MTESDNQPPLPKKTLHTENSGNGHVTIMLVDDSTLIRNIVANLLQEDPNIKIVASVANGALAIEAAAQYKPDIVILDVEMPVMDGMTALPLILKASPRSKIVMFSAMTERGADITIKALSLGAVECLVKPTAGRGMRGGEFHTYILSLINNLKPRKAQSSGVAPTATRLASKKVEIIAIGSSTGGPQALFEVLKHCRDLPVPIVITQHMPPKFTKILADHITKQCALETYEAEDGMVLRSGKAYLAKGGFHMLIKSGAGAAPILALDDGAPVNYCKPAVDPMLDSLIELYGANILSVILTGMGHDGLAGCRKLAELGGAVVAQDEATSVVWGMPGAVAQAGICQAVLPIGDIGPHIRRMVGKI